MDNSIIVNGTIDDNLKVLFQSTVETLLRKRRSFLSDAPFVKKEPIFNGRVKGLMRAGSVSLEEANERNAKVKYKQYMYDTRWVGKNRYSGAWMIDNDDIRDAIVNPKSDLYSAIIDAVHDQQDRSIIKACIDSVKVGGQLNGNYTYLTAEEDGVKTIDATAGYDFSVIQKIKQNFGNRYAENITVLQTVNEESELLNDIKATNNYYYHNNASGARFSDGAVIENLGIKFISSFAGSDNGQNGVGKLANTFLPEIGGTRLCLALAKDSIQGGSIDMEVRFEPKVEGYVDSCSVVVVMHTSAVRLQGEKVQIIKTTI